jgi:hypothetical protein
VGSGVQQGGRGRQNRPVHYDVSRIVAKQRLDFLAERAVSRAGLGWEPVARGRIEVNGRLVRSGDQLPSFRSHAILVDAG